MKKNLITAVGLISLVVLSYVGIAQLGGNKNVAKDPDPMDVEQHAMDVEQQEDETMSETTNKSTAEKANNGVVTTDSGLQYKIEKEGTGDKPITGQKVYRALHWLD